MPTQRLAVFFDGTDNTPADNTNVWRSHELLADSDNSNVPQLKKYIKGVGTDTGYIARGSIFGDGVISRIREGYEWLAQNYRDDTEIYVFGFSRGAFTARSLVQLIATCGLVRPAALVELSSGRIFARYEAISRDEEQPIWKLRYWDRHPMEKPRGWAPSQEDAMLIDDQKVRVVKVRMAGLWDTVGAIGTDAMANQGALTQKSAMHNVRPTKSQEYGYHAIAIDEHRPMFDVTLWRTFVEQGKESETLARYAEYYEQRWFIGAHSDVGGGYLDNRLPDLSLAWIQAKASALGLTFQQTISPSPGGWRAPIHDSFVTFGWGILNIWAKIMPGDQRTYRQIGRTPRAVTTASGVSGDLCSINETIDLSVLNRWKDDPTYRPRSLVEYFSRNPAAQPT